jgi:hypothetical protein
VHIRNIRSHPRYEANIFMNIRVCETNGVNIFMVIHVGLGNEANIFIGTNTPYIRVYSMNIFV